MNSLPRVAVIDYKMCNLFSVVHACRAAGLDPLITSKPAEVEASAGVLLPGVGAFGDAAKNIRELGLDKAIEKAIAEGKPFMGICLGFQLLFDESEEFGAFPGLGILPGKVLKFPGVHNGMRMKVPQIGWNRVHFQKASRFMNGIEDGEFMYFVHSYYVAPKDGAAPLTMTDYNGFEYCSAIEKDNLFACQFHPEKSSLEGMKIYQNWAAAVSCK